ncbi:hypothetical protein BH23CHL5_BH23CHL5_20930 [soil metagenome]
MTVEPEPARETAIRAATSRARAEREPEPLATLATMHPETPLVTINQAILLQVKTQQVSPRLASPVLRVKTAPAKPLRARIPHRP